MESREAEDRLLVALLLWSREQGFGFLLAQKIVSLALTDEAKEFGHLIVELLEGEDLVATDRQLYDDVYEMVVKLTAKGLRVSERRLREHPEYAELASIAPASDRYVSLADNERAEVTRDLTSLKDEARGSNDVHEEERLIALSEIAAFEATIVQQRVSTDLIQRFVDRVLKWMMTVFTGAIFAEVAQRLIKALAPLLATA